jgi:predicted metal-dependent hydrolase
MTTLLVVDQVVVHELVHLEKKNNSRIFWDKVKSLMPDYKKYQGVAEKKRERGFRI